MMYSYVLRYLDKKAENNAFEFYLLCKHCLNQVVDYTE